MSDDEKEVAPAEVPAPETTEEEAKEEEQAD